MWWNLNPHWILANRNLCNEKFQLMVVLIFLFLIRLAHRPLPPATRRLPDTTFLFQKHFQHASTSIISIDPSIAWGRLCNRHEKLMRRVIWNVFVIRHWCYGPDAGMTTTMKSTLPRRSDKPTILHSAIAKAKEGSKKNSKVVAT